MPGGRPSRFTLNASHPLATGLVFAGLAPSGLVGSTLYPDSSLYKHHGTLTNMDPATDWVWSHDLQRWCVDFDGTGDFINLPFKPTVSAFTFSFWGKESSVTTANNIIVGWQNSYAGLFNYPSTGNITLVDADGSAIKTWSAAWTATAKWHHWTYTQSGSGASTTVDLFRNGISLGTASVTASACVTPIYIADNSGANLTNFAGWLADISLHNRALSPAEIAILANPDPMLGGLILPPHRKLWTVSGGAGPASLTIADSAHAHTSDIATLTESFALAVADSDHLHASDNVDLSSTGQLAIDDSSHVHASDNATLTTVWTLVVADSSHLHASDDATLTTVFTLVVQDSDHSHASDNLTLSTDGTLSVADSAHSHASGNLTLTTLAVLTIADSAHSHASDNLDLTAGAQFEIADSAHSHASSNLTLTTIVTLAIADSVHLHSSDDVTLSTGYIFSPTVHYHAIEGPSKKRKTLEGPSKKRKTLTGAG